MQFAILVLMLAMLGSLYAAAWRAFRGERRFPNWVPYEPRRDAPWNWLEFTGAFLTHILLQAFSGAAAQRAWGVAGDSLTAPILFATAVGGLIGLAVAAAGVMALSGATPRDLGWRADCAARDIKLGFVAFIVMAPIVFGIQAVLAALFRPTQHPLVISLQDRPDPLLFSGAFLLAVVMAPLAEEFLFRVLLQGWLERLASRSRATHLPVAGSKDSVVLDSNPETNAIGVPDPAHAARAGDAPRSASGPQIVAALDSHAADVNPDAPPGERTHEGPTLEGAFAARPPWWPMFASAAVFALLHLRSEPDPDVVALFVLALGMGYLYRQTHRFLPSVVVHACLNGSSFLMLALATWSGAAPPRANDAATNPPAIEAAAEHESPDASLSPAPSTEPLAP